MDGTTLLENAGPGACKQCVAWGGNHSVLLHPARLCHLPQFHARFPHLTIHSVMQQDYGIWQNGEKLWENSWLVVGNGLDAVDDSLSNAEAGKNLPQQLITADFPGYGA
jgi:hypothetical protein